MKKSLKKEKYIKFCDKNSIPLFSQYWWLDAVCGQDNWDVILAEKGEQVIASMPYFLQKKSVFNTIFMPPLTQTMGPYVRYEKNLNQNKRVSLEKKVFSEIIEKIPHKSFFFQNFHYSIKNWLPFYWKGYKQSSYYTYLVEDIKNHEQVLKNFSSSKRAEVKKGIKQSLEVVFDLDVDTLYNHHIATLAEKKQKIVYTKPLLKNIVAEAKKRNLGQIIGVKKDNELLCCMLVVWDNESAYNLITSINFESRKYGAASFMFYEAIKYSSQFVDIFDFEGSMVENIESSYRQFGTKQVPYFRITKANNILLKIAEALR